MCVPASVCMHVCIQGLSDTRKRAWNPPELELRVVSRQGTGSTLGPLEEPKTHCRAFSSALRDFKIFLKN